MLTFNSSLLSMYCSGQQTTLQAKTKQKQHSISINLFRNKHKQTTNIKSRTTWLSCGKKTSHTAANSVYFVPRTSEITKRFSSLMP